MARQGVIDYPLAEGRPAPADGFKTVGFQAG
jgi:hypothetical protein